MSEPMSIVEAPASLWRNPSFVRLWFAQTVSNAGSQVTALALPLTAVLVLGATPVQMGFLGIAGRAPNLLFDLFAGVWVDRTRRRPILVGADLGRALLLGTILIAAAFGYLTFAQLYLVTFVVGTLTAFFSLASISILPSLVKREQLVDANSKLAITDSILTIAAPSAAGGLVQLLGAPRRSSPMRSRTCCRHCRSGGSLHLSSRQAGHSGAASGPRSAKAYASSYVRRSCGRLPCP